MLAVAAVALACSLAKTFVGPTLVERRVVALIKSEGGRVTYYAGLYYNAGGAVIGETWAGGPVGNPLVRLFAGDGRSSVSLDTPTEQAVRSLGDFRHLDQVFVHDVQLSRSMLESISRLQRVTGLHLVNAKMDDSAAQGMRWPESLEGLLLKQCSVPDRAFESVKRLRLLTVLYLFDNSSADSQVSLLGAMPTLKYLAITGSSLSDRGVLDLPTNRNLEYLNLQETTVTDEAMPHLSTFEALHILELSGTLISDNGILPLTRLDQLEVLRLSDTKITAGCIPDLANFKRLQHLDVSGTPLSQDALGELRKAIPNVKIRAE